MAKIELLYGNEPYCVSYHKAQAIKKLAMPELDSATFSEFSEDVTNFCSSVSMFGGQKLCILQVEELKSLDTKEFREFMNETSCDVLIIPEKVDGRMKQGKFFKSLPLHACDKVSENGLKKMIKNFLGEEVKIEDDAMNELVKRLHYLDREDVNLFTVRSVCSILGAYTNSITIENVKNLVDNYEEDNAFVLIDCVLNKNISAIRHQENLLNRQGKSSIGALSAMLREYRIAYKLVYLNKSLNDIGVKFSKLKGLSPKNILRGMEILTGVIEGIKTGRYDDNTALTLACERLMVEE